MQPAIYQPKRSWQPNFLTQSSYRQWGNPAINGHSVDAEIWIPLVDLSGFVDEPFKKD
jgi:hypothetical protein